MTIQIYKNQPSQFTVTLREVASESLPLRWLFVFTHDTSGFVNKVVLDNVSTSILFDQFIYDEDVHGELETGEYKYEAYQVPEDATDETDGIINEIGKMKVLDLSTERPAFIVDATRKVYE